MAIDVTMPQMGESIVEGTIAKWLVKEGDVVTEDQPLVEISTDKVDTEIPSPGAGRIAKIVAAEGQTLPVGATLAVIEQAGAETTAKLKAVAPKAAPKAEPPADRPAVKPAPPPQPMQAAGVGVHEAVSEAGGSRRFSPVVLKMAAEEGIDLSRVPGTGIGGRVSKRDLQRYLDSLRKGGVPGAAAAPAPTNGVAQSSSRPASTAAATTQPPPAQLGAGFRPPVYQPIEGDIVEPFTRRRKFIAEHMVFSKTHSPHVGTVAEVDVTNAMRLREKHKDEFARREGFSLTFLPLAAAATVRALKEFPRMNASVVGDSVVTRREINLGIAMDTDEGLLVPVVRAAEGMSVVGIARAIEGLRRKVAEKRIAADDLAGGSFTLSNPGREGNLYGFAIINQPQVGILRMGEVKKRPVVVEVDGADAIAIRTMMYLALSYDHRVVDGVLGNRFLYRAARILEEADFEL
ncbi:dihydrolipoamide acetyltransferase family protein [Candidatus Binatus sp.]|jgi:2-oxoglutarate dehydrogenase E2 component (dihydrolipoamide succinyltransferase)|uniref:dihydrolipoamide acetyltransferase family protein n=2 Tax=Candidatus Binatus sp. TaxID=2811406 RepID=UPI003BCDC8CE